MRAIRLSLLGVTVLSTFMPSSNVAAHVDDDYVASVESWRQERRAKLLADDGYLAVAGLFWLKEGENTFGADPENDMVLPPGSAPGRVGVFEHRAGRTRVRIAPGVEVTMNGAPVKETEVRPSRPDSTDVLEIGGLALSVHASGKRYAIRLRDENSRFRREFTSLRWYPPDPSYRVTADFVPFDGEKTIELLNSMGDLQAYRAPGYVTFELKGQKVRLDPVIRGDQLLFIFRDETSGRTTYPSARFLYADMPVDGKVVLDFNKAINPACAFTPYAACPYPPEQNRLSVSIQAGELKYLGTGAH
jgi:uncharacterized protein (DUF1684 family)